MRKVAVGLLGLSLTATGLVTGTSASAAPTPKLPTAAPSIAEPANADHDLPNPLETKRRALRQEGLSEVISGKTKPQKINGSTVVKVGKTQAAGRNNARTTTSGVAQTQDQYVELAREKTDQIFVILTEFGNERHPSYPDQDTAPAIPGPTRFDGPLHNEIPAARPDGRQLHRLAGRLHPASYFQDLYFGTEVTSRSRVLRGPVLGPVQRRR